MAGTLKESSVRPKLHITGERGWINDPNGLVKFRGEYHMFFQYYPDGVKWGSIRWGHVKSRDLIKWEFLPEALIPDENEDGCFSGTALVYGGKLYLMYTSFKENGGGESTRQLQALASSGDGVHFKKHGIVIGEKQLPSEYAPCDFRDPKLFEKGGKFYCLVAARKRDGRGRILLFSSDNLFDWVFVSDILKRDSGGIMIECPDYIGSLGLLTYCEQFQPVEKDKHLNIHSTFYRLGKIDPKSGRASFGNSEIIDYGFDFYAAQTFKEDKVMIGWLGMWERDFHSDKYGFAGMLTVPRKLGVKSGKLTQTPIYKGFKAVKKSGFKIEDGATSGVIEIKVAYLKNLRLILRAKGYMRTEITSDGEWLVFDRSASGAAICGKEEDGYSLKGLRKMPLDRKKRHKITVVFDLFSVEIFADGRALSSVIYPDPDADGIELSVTAAKCGYTRYEAEGTGLFK